MVVVNLSGSQCHPLDSLRQPVQGSADELGFLGVSSAKLKKVTHARQ